MIDNQTHDSTMQAGAPIDPVATPELGSDVVQDFAALTAERDRLANEKAEVQDLLLRRTAEFDNFRRRSERDRAEFAEYAAMETVKALLPVFDDFERALKAETADRDFAKGMELIYNRMFDLMKKQGLSPIDTTGATFDPNLHHAIEMVESTEAEDQAILAEFQRGYHFKNRLLRPALVKVAVRQ